MKKHFFILLSLIAMHTYAMKMEVKNKIIKPIHLSLFPDDILNLIASYLEIETEQEFIERTKAMLIKKIPQKYLEYRPELSLEDAMDGIVTKQEFIKRTKAMLTENVPQKC